MAERTQRQLAELIERLLNTSAMREEIIKETLRILERTGATQEELDLAAGWLRDQCFKVKPKDTDG